MVKRLGLEILQGIMKTLDPNEDGIYKFLGCEQRDEI